MKNIASGLYVVFLILTVIILEITDSWFLGSQAVTSYIFGGVLLFWAFTHPPKNKYLRISLRLLGTILILLCAYVVTGSWVFRDLVF